MERPAAKEGERRRAPRLGARMGKCNNSRFFPTASKPAASCTARLLFSLLMTGGLVVVSAKRRVIVGIGSRFKRWAAV